MIPGQENRKTNNGRSKADHLTLPQACYLLGEGGSSRSGKGTVEVHKKVKGPLVIGDWRKVRSTSPSRTPTCAIRLQKKTTTNRLDPLDTSARALHFLKSYHLLRVACSLVIAVHCTVRLAYVS